MSDESVSYWLSPAREAEIRSFTQGLNPYRTGEGPEHWGPDCARCGADEYRIDGYCSCECRDAHDYEHAIADALAALDACRRELAEASA